jgi:endogenous inhibitor of DNA gyrase (YacG/DUF329 family)
LQCIICGKEIEKSSYSHKIICSSECFHIDFWNDNVEIKDDPKVVRVNGEQYYIGKENSHSLFRGFGGSKYIIKFFDGREVVSTNLWYNGKIPDSHKELLPDNAEFIRDKVIEEKHLLNTPDIF